MRERPGGEPSRAGSRKPPTLACTWGFRLGRLALGVKHQAPGGVIDRACAQQDHRIGNPAIDQGLLQQALAGGRTAVRERHQVSSQHIIVVAVHEPDPAVGLDRYRPRASVSGMLGALVATARTSSARAASRLASSAA